MSDQPARVFSIVELQAASLGGGTVERVWRSRFATHTAAAARIKEVSLTNPELAARLRVGGPFGGRI